MAGLFVFFWFIGGGVALRYLVLFVGVMSCMYVVWDVIGQGSFPFKVEQNAESLETDDTITRKVNSSDASVFADECGCCPSQGPSFAIAQTVCWADTQYSLGFLVVDHSHHFLCTWNYCWLGSIQGEFL